MIRMPTIEPTVRAILQDMEIYGTDSLMISFTHSKRALSTGVRRSIAAWTRAAYFAATSSSCATAVPSCLRFPVVCFPKKPGFSPDSREVALELPPGASGFASGRPRPSLDMYVYTAGAHRKSQMLHSKIMW